MLKNAYFFGKKNCKNRFSVGESAPVFRGAPPPDPRVVISAYYYNFVEFVSSAKYILFC